MRSQDSRVRSTSCLGRMGILCSVCRGSFRFQISRSNSCFGVLCGPGYEMLVSSFEHIQHVNKRQARGEEKAPNPSHMGPEAGNSNFWSLVVIRCPRQADFPWVRRSVDVSPSRLGLGLNRTQRTKHISVCFSNSSTPRYHKSMVQCSVSKLSCYHSLECFPPRHRGIEVE